METYTDFKEPEENSSYYQQRQEGLRSLTDDLIDAPIVDLINRLNHLPYCFTLQCCYGHFVYGHQTDIHNFEPLPADDSIAEVTYRIAYLAFCIENSIPGRDMLDRLIAVTGIDAGYVQFGCADWFWERQVNSYVLQVEPDRCKYQDTAILDLHEARYVEKIRDLFFNQLRELLEKMINR